MKKIKISNKIYKITLYFFLTYGLLLNLLLFNLNIVPILKLSLGITALILLIIKHEKVKIITQIILSMSILGILLQVISILIKFGINEKLNYGSIDYISMLVILIVSIYLFIGSRKYITHI
jgi:hypothetical protein